MKMTVLFVVVVAIMSSRVCVGVEEQDAAIDGAAATNFVNEFFVAYNAKNREALSNMIVDKQKVNRIVRGSERQRENLLFSIKSVDMDALKVIAEVSNKVESRSVEIELICEGGNVKIKDCNFLQAKEKTKVLIGAFELGRLFCETVGNSDTNALLRLMTPNEDACSSVQLEKLLQKKNMQWVARALDGKLLVTFKRVKVDDGGETYLVFEVMDKSKAKETTTKYIGCKDNRITNGVEKLPSGADNQ